MASESGVSIDDEEYLDPSGGDTTDNIAHGGVDDLVTEGDGQVTNNTARMTPGDSPVPQSQVTNEIPNEIQVTGCGGSDEIQTNRVVKNGGVATAAEGQVNEESDEEDTAGEFEDILPQDSTSTATDAPLEPIDFIETHPRNHGHCFTRAGGIGATHSGAGRNILQAAGPGIQWSVLEELSENAKRGALEIW